MKSLIKKLLRENLLDEAMLTSKDLPLETALFQKDGRNSLVLYNPKTKESYGVISAGLRGEIYDVDKVAAEHGFGPYMYEFAMMVANMKGKGLMPDRSGEVTPSAFKIWEKFYNRGDIKKTPIEPFTEDGSPNPNYSVALITGNEVDSYDTPKDFKIFWDGLDSVRKDYLTKYNTSYTMQPNNDFRDLLARGKNYIKKGFNVDTAMTSGQKLFFDKYD